MKIQVKINGSLLELTLIGLVLLPSAMVFLPILFLWIAGKAVDWKGIILMPAIVQLISIVAFSVHASRNKKLTQEDVTDWILQFIGLIPFGMIRYWKEHVWNCHRTP
jgi:hypothetical protein